MDIREVITYFIIGYLILISVILYGLSWITSFGKGGIESLTDSGIDEGRDDEDKYRKAA